MSYPPPASGFPPPTGSPVRFPPSSGPPVQFAAPPAEVGAVGSVVGVPTRATIPLNKLAPEAALRRLELTIVRRLEGFLHGDHLGLLPGHGPGHRGDHLGLLPGPGSDISDARIYVPGEDDVRRIDWAVTARTTVPFVRDTIS